MSRKKVYYAHKTSDVEDGSSIGRGTCIWRFSYIFQGAVIGKNCKLGQNVVVHSTARIGNNVKIQNNVSIYDGVVLEDNVFCGPSCVFTNIDRPRSAIARNSSVFYQKTWVKNGATIGANATILCGITIGKFAVIGAGSVVTADVQDYELVYGSPAKHQGWVSECGEKLIFKKNVAVCPLSKKKYKKSKGVVSLI